MTGGPTSGDLASAGRLRGAHLHTVGFHVTDLHATPACYRLLGLVVPEADGAPVVAATVTGAAGTDLTLTWATAAVLQQLDPDRLAVLTDPDGNRVACTAPLSRTTAQES